VAAGGILPARPPTIAAMIFEIYGAIHGQNVDWQEINLKSDRLLDERFRSSNHINLPF
jgi:hypothetical protein